MTGFLVRIAWEDLEPSPGEYRWDLLETQFERANQYGKKIALSVVNGLHAPAWLYEQGAGGFHYEFHDLGAEVLPIPWDTTYLAAWTELIDSLGARYANNPALSLVHATHSTFNGFEMQLPQTPVDLENWSAAGYSNARLIESWNTILDRYALAFPACPIDLDIHPVLRSDSVSQGIAEHVEEYWGDRFGLFAAWWSQHNTEVYSAQYQLLQEFSGNPFSAVQFVTNATNNPEGFGEGGIEEALALAFRQGIEYWEVWDTDLRNEDLAELFETYADYTTVEGSATETVPTTFDMVAFPNPFNSRVTLVYTLPMSGVVSAKLYNSVGREVRTLPDRMQPSGQHSFTLDAGNLATGSYYLQLSQANHTSTQKLVLLK